MNKISRIAFKFAVMISVSAAVLFSAGIIVEYIHSFEYLSRTAGKSHKETARVLASSITDTIEGQTRLIMTAADDGSLEQALLNVSPNYSHSFSKESGLISALITDKAGKLFWSSHGIPAASYADKKWWTEVVNSGKGGAFINDIEYDESSSAWGLPIAVPITDSAKNVIGVYRALVDIKTLFNTLAIFKAGQTGVAAVVDNNSYLVFYPGAKPFANKFCGYNELQKVIASGSDFFLMEGVYLHPGKTLAAFSDIKEPAVISNGMNWRVFVCQSDREVLSPLYKSTLQMVLGEFILVALIFLAGLMLGSRFMKPIKSLKEAMKRLGSGDIDYRFKTVNKDEIGELAQTFNEMVDNLKETTTSLQRFNKEIKLESDIVLVASGLRDSIYAAKGTIKNTLEEKGMQLDAKRRSEMEGALNEMDKLANGLDNLIYIDQIENGKVSLKTEVADIRDILKKTIFIFEPKIRSKGLDFKLELPKTKVMVCVDIEKIKSIFTSLLDNALKYTEKGCIEIAVRDAGKEVECSVTDTGIGISGANIAKAFERFQKGTGASLYIAKALIELQKGRIKAQSQPGRSTTFTFTLPKADT